MSTMKKILAVSALTLLLACTDLAPRSTGSLAETKGSAGQTATVAPASVVPEARPSLAGMTTAGGGSSAGANAATYGAAFTGAASLPISAGSTSGSTSGDLIHKNVVR